jgi:hypothetical protein
MDHMSSDLPAAPSAEEIGSLDAFSNHEARRHAYVDLICDHCQRSTAAMHRVVEVMYRVCGVLRDCRLAIASNTREEEIRVALVADLYEEYGQGTAMRGRPFLMRQMLQALGYTELTPIHLSSRVDGVLDELMNYCHVEAPLKAVGCIWIAAERNGAAFFGQVLDTLRKTRTLSPTQLSLLALGNDESRERHHYLRAAVEPFMVNGDSRRLFQEGVHAGNVLVDELWMSMLCDQPPVGRRPYGVS